MIFTLLRTLFGFIGLWMLGSMAAWAWSLWSGFEASGYWFPREAAAPVILDAGVIWLVAMLGVSLVLVAVRGIDR